MTFSYQQLEFLFRVSNHLATAIDQNKTLTTVLDWMSGECRFWRGVISLMSPDGNEVQAYLTSRDVPTAKFDLMRYRQGEGITGQVFASGQSLYIDDLTKNPNFLNRSGLRADIDIEKYAFFCIPIKYHDLVIGTLSADKRKRDIAEPAMELAFLQSLTQLLAPFVQRRRLEDQFEIFQRACKPGGVFDRIIGKSNPISEVKKMLARVASVNTTILVTGETGTGKGVAAEVIHMLSPRAEEPFVEVNCGAIPENLIESELFGHEKGAFTGASQQRIGVMERAGIGTIFLDEIGELPLPAQTRLLRVLQKREFERVGGNRTLPCQARIIAATNRNLEDVIREGQFRTDLFYRLNVFPIHMPSLRERGKADIMLLVDFFVQRLAREMGKEISRLDTPAIDMLTAYHWPGNVRELENVIERAILLVDGNVIHGHHLPPSLQMQRYSRNRENRGSFQTLVQNYEIELITEALKDTGGRQSRAAEQLGLTKRIIQYKIRKYGIEYARFR